MNIEIRNNIIFQILTLKPNFNINRANSVFEKFYKIEFGEEPVNVSSLIIQSFEDDVEKENKRMQQVAKQKQALRLQRNQSRINSIKNSINCKKDTIEYQLGFYIGEFIFDKFLPSLSVDYLQTYNVVEVSEEDTLEYKRLYVNYTDKLDNKLPYDEQWKEYSKFNKYLKEKYLPSKLECVVRKLPDINNILEFKDGISSFLWDCDCCNYSTLIIDIEEDRYSTKIILYLNSDKDRLLKYEEIDIAEFEELSYSNVRMIQLNDEKINSIKDNLNFDDLEVSIGLNLDSALFIFNKQVSNDFIEFEHLVVSIKYDGYYYFVHNNKYYKSEFSDGFFNFINKIKK